MSTTQGIFNILADAGAPLSKQQILELLPEGTNADLISSLLSQRRKAGELISCVEDGVAKWSIAPGIDANSRKTVKRAAPEPSRRAADSKPANTSTPVSEDAVPLLPRGLDFFILKDGAAPPIDIAVQNIMRAAVLANAPRPVLLVIVALQDAVQAWRGGHG